MEEYWKEVREHTVEKRKYIYKIANSNEYIEKEFLVDMNTDLNSLNRMSLEELHAQKERLLKLEVAKATSALCTDGADAPSSLKIIENKKKHDFDYYYCKKGNYEVFIKYIDGLIRDYSPLLPPYTLDEVKELEDMLPDGFAFPDDLREYLTKVSREFILTNSYPEIIDKKSISHVLRRIDEFKEDQNAKDSYKNENDVEDANEDENDIEDANVQNGEENSELAYYFGLNIGYSRGEIHLYLKKDENFGRIYVNDNDGYFDTTPLFVGLIDIFGLKDYLSHRMTLEKQMDYTKPKTCRYWY